MATTLNEEEAVLVDDRNFRVLGAHTIDRLVTHLGDDGWGPEKRNDKVVTVSKTVHGLMLWRSTTVVPVAADILYKFVCDLNTMARFDPSLSLCKEMRRLDDQHFLNYYQYLSPAAFTHNRDFVLFESHVARPDGTYVTAATSARFEGEPDVPDGYTRGYVHVSGFFITPLPTAPTSHSVLSYVVCANPGGMLPTILVNLSTSYQAFSLARAIRLIFEEEAASTKEAYDEDAAEGAAADEAPETDAPAGGGLFALIERVIDNPKLLKRALESPLLGELMGGDTAEFASMLDTPLVEGLLADTDKLNEIVDLMLGGDDDDEEGSGSEEGTGGSGSGGSGRSVSDGVGGVGASSSGGVGSGGRKAKAAADRAELFAFFQQMVAASNPGGAAAAAAAAAASATTSTTDVTTVGEAADPNKAFWDEYLQGVEAATPIFGDTSHMPAATPEAAAVDPHTYIFSTTHHDASAWESVTHTIPDGFNAAQFDGAAERLAVSSFDIGVASWALLSMRLAGEAQVVVGIDGGGGGGGGADGNGNADGDGDDAPLPILAVHTGGQIAPSAWMTNVAEQVAWAQSHAPSPRARRTYAALFDSVCTTTDSASWSGGAAGGRREQHPLTIAFDLPHSISYSFNGRRLSRATIDRLNGYLWNVAGAMTAGTVHDVLRLDFLPPAERAHLVTDLNDNFDTVSDLETRIEAQFEAQAAAHPDRVAIHLPDAGRAVTYGQLNADANRLAHQLRARLPEGSANATPLVAVLLNREAELVTALLATLKAGFAYVPQDPAYPQTRIQHVINNAGIDLIVTQRAIFEAIFEAAPPGVTLICLDDEDVAAAVAASPAGNLDPPASASSMDLMYILYTSGSTGVPKGVQIFHRAVANQFNAFAAQPGFTGDDTILAVSPVAFDIAQLEILMPLTLGADLVLVPSAVARDGRTLRSVLEQHHPSIAQATPATWRLLLAAGWSGDPRLTIWCGGEALPPKLASDLLPRCAALWNLYGPTESTIWASTLEITPEIVEAAGAQSLPIGGPIANYQFYVLDRNGELVPDGVLGVLHISGEGMCAGYRNSPEENRKTYVANPYTVPLPAPLRANVTMVNSGDLVRRRPDGLLQFVGRIDHQVKIRGFRIELGEVESALGQHPAVARAIALAQRLGNEATESSLVAHVMLKPQFRGGAVLDRDLIAFLKDLLPPYMVPSAFSFVEQWPLSPTGKVDRKRLPPVSLAGGRSRYVAPADDLERRLVAIFEDILGADRVGVDDSFFELGGHSLLGVPLMGAINAYVERDLPFSVIFNNSTVAELAALIRAEGGGLNGNCSVDTSVTGHSTAASRDHGDAFDPATSIVPLQVHPEVNNDRERPPLFLVHPAFSSSVCYGALAYYLGAPCYGLEPRQAYASIEAMATDYVAAVRSVQPQGPYHIGGWSFGATVVFEMAQQLTAAGEQVALLAMLDGRAPLPQDEYLADKNREAMQLALLCRGTKQYFGESLDITYTELAPFGIDKQLLIVMRRALERNMLDTMHPVLAASFFARFMKDLQANDALADKYTPRLYTGGEVTLFRAEKVIPIGGLESDPILAHETLGWGDLTPAPVKIVPVPGDHESIVFHPDVPHLAKALRDAIDACGGDVSDGSDSGGAGAATDQAAVGGGVGVGGSVTPRSPARATVGGTVLGLTTSGLDADDGGSGAAGLAFGLAFVAVGATLVARAWR